MQIKIQPAILPQHRHAIQDLLQEIVGQIGRVDGGGTMTDGTESHIVIYPLKGYSETDLRILLTGHADDYSRELPVHDPTLPDRVPES